jgi:sugar phosphate isomerase/epimerase
MTAEARTEERIRRVRRVIAAGALGAVLVAVAAKSRAKAPEPASSGHADWSPLRPDRVTPDQ